MNYSGRFDPKLPADAEGDELARIYSPDLVVTVQNLLDARQSGNQNLRRLARDRVRCRCGGRAGAARPSEPWRAPRPRGRRGQ